MVRDSVPLTSVLRCERDVIQETKCSFHSNFYTPAEMEDIRSLNQFKKSQLQCSVELRVIKFHSVLSVRACVLIECRVLCRPYLQLLLNSHQTIVKMYPLNCANHRPCGLIVQ